MEKCTGEKIYEVRILKDPETGHKTAEHWLQGGTYHNDDGPAKREWYADSGNLKSEEWLFHGLRHRADGPSKIRYFPDGRISFQLWYRNGVLDAEKGQPAFLEKSLCHDVPVNEQYWIDGVKHREDGPAVIFRDEKTGEDIGLEYWENGKMHRSDGPAQIWTDVDTKVDFQIEYYLNGERHRTDGPAVIIRDDQTGEITKEVYYTHGRRDEPSHTCSLMP